MCKGSDAFVTWGMKSHFWEQELTLDNCEYEPALHAHDTFLVK